MKRITILVLSLILVASCSNKAAEPPPPTDADGYRQYVYEFFGPFDTVTQIMAFATDEADFIELRDYIVARMTELHKLYNIFEDYEGINNIKTINENAGIAPVEVSRDIIDLLEFSVMWHERTGGAFNVALGPILRVWHEYRERYAGIDGNLTSLPDMDELVKLNELTDINDVVLDIENQTVFLRKAGMSLDVGSVAKGFAVQRIITEVRIMGLAVQDFLIDAGGNVAAHGTRRLRDTGLWRVDVLNPYDDSKPLAGFEAWGGTSVVTSGNYQRYYMYGDRVMGHIISPFTLMPVDHFTSVTVVARNSGAADVLSTAMYILSHQAGLDLAELYALDVVWLLQGGGLRYYPFIR
jgi:thiamine biosynthesis lipoprotein